VQGKDKMDYCVSFQTEHVMVLKNTSLSMSLAEYGGEPSDAAAETLADRL